MLRFQNKTEKTPAIPLAVITVRVPVELHAQIKSCAHKHEVSMNTLVIAALKSAMEESNGESPVVEGQSPQ